MATTLRVAELDFDTIKNNLREFLRTKPEFTDYDYEGSGLSVLMDLLAYNTHYNAVIANMLVQEMYLDTAVKKQSLALIAKRLGYTPKSIRAPRAVVSMEVFPTGSPDTLTLAKNTQFTSRISYNQNFTFVNRDAITVNRNSEGRYIFDSIELYEGDNATFRYVVNNPVTQKFEIPSTLVDTSLLRVYVQEEVGSTEIQEWRQFDSIIDVNETTKCYFVKLNEFLKYEIYFGDGIIGKQIVPGNVIIIDYITTNGTIANGASVFQLAGAVENTTNVVLSTIVPAYGGSVAESLDEIRRNAQNRVLSQNRAVTEGDYAEVISRMLPIETIAVYGGETVDPPQYGKVFISAKLTGTTQALTQTQKDDVIRELKRRSVLALLHEFIDPEYTFIGVNTEVKYDATKTTLSGTTLSTAVYNKLQEYAAINLNKFDSTFEYSKLVAFIDTIDNSILSNDTNITLRKERQLVFGVSAVYEFNFYTGVIPSTSNELNLTSSIIRLLGYPDIDMMVMDNMGVIYPYYVLNNSRVVIDMPLGTIDYTTGSIRLTMTATVTAVSTLSITVKPVNRNVLPTRNNILTLSSNDINIKMRT